MNIIRRKTVIKSMDFSLYCYNFFLFSPTKLRAGVLCAVKGLSVLFDEQDIKIYLKIIEICLILKAITILASCDPIEAEAH